MPSVDGGELQAYIYGDANALARDVDRLDRVRGTSDDDDRVDNAPRSHRIEQSGRDRAHPRRQLEKKNSRGNRAVQSGRIRPTQPPLTVQQSENNMICGRDLTTRYL